MKDEVQGCSSTHWMQSSKHSAIKDLKVNNQESEDCRKAEAFYRLKLFHFICCRLKSGHWSWRACCRVLDSLTLETSNSGKGPGVFFFKHFKVDSVDAMQQSWLNTDWTCKYSVSVSLLPGLDFSTIMCPKASPSQEQQVPSQTWIKTIKSQNKTNNPNVKSDSRPTSPKSSCGQLCQIKT